MTSNAPATSIFERYNVSKDDPQFRLGTPANLKVFIPILYGVPLLIFYLFVLAVIAVRLKASFYRIFAIVGLTDIASWITTLIFRRAHSAPFMFPFYEAMPTEGFFITLVYFWDYYNGYAQQAATFFLTLNRFTAVWQPARHRKLWKWLPYVAYLVVPVFPIPFTWFIWLSDVEIMLENEDNYWDGYQWDGYTKPFGLRKSMFTTPISIAHAVLLLAMNVSVLIKLFLMRREASNSYQSKDDRRDTDVKLCIMTLIVFAYSAVYVTITAVFYMTNNSMPGWAVDMLFSIESFWLDIHIVTTPLLLVLMSSAVIFYINNNNMPGWAIDLLFSIVSFGLDVHVLTAPWFLLLMSTAVREELRKLLFCMSAGNADVLFSTSTRSAPSRDLASPRSNTARHRTVVL